MIIDVKKKKEIQRPQVLANNSICKLRHLLRALDLGERRTFSSRRRDVRATSKVAISSNGRANGRCNASYLSANMNSGSKCNEEIFIAIIIRQNEEEEEVGTRHVCTRERESVCVSANVI